MPNTQFACRVAAIFPTIQLALCVPDSMSEATVPEEYLVCNNQWTNES